MKKRLLLIGALIFVATAEAFPSKAIPAYQAREDGLIPNDYLQEVWARDYVYTDSVRLARAMEGLVAIENPNSPDANEAAMISTYLKDIAIATNMTEVQARQEWDGYVSVKSSLPDESAKVGKLVGNSHWASIQQLQSGSVLADNIPEINSPVFAAMLSPTIGLTGPGGGVPAYILENTAGKSKGISNHAVVHDAFGFLYNQLDIGPGYAYAINSPALELNNTDSPLSGQSSGIVNAMKLSECPIDQALVNSPKFVGALEGTFNTLIKGQVGFANAKEEIVKLASQAWDEVKNTAELVWDGAKWVANGVWDGTKWVAERAKDWASWAGDKISSGASWLMEQGGNLLSSAGSFFGIGGPNAEASSPTAAVSIIDGQPRWLGNLLSGSLINSAIERQSHAPVQIDEQKNIIEELIKAGVFK